MTLGFGCGGAPTGKLMQFYPCQAQRVTCSFLSLAVLPRLVAASPVLPTCACLFFRFDDDEFVCMVSARQTSSKSASKLNSSSSSSETPSTSPSEHPHGQTRSLPDDAEQDSLETSRRRLNAVISDLHSVTHQFGEEGLETQWYDDQHWIEEFCAAGPDGMPYTLVAKAKQEEMERFARMKVYEVVP